MKPYFFSVASLFLLLFIQVLPTQAQERFGYMNSASILSLMPETSAADDALKVYQDSLLETGKVKGKAFEEKLSKYVEEANAGVLTPMQIQEQETALRKEREELMALEQDVMQKIQQKRQELYDPILSKVQQAIDEVGKENGFAFIFDASVPNVILFANETEDVASMVKEKLGIQEEEDD